MFSIFFTRNLSCLEVVRRTALLRVKPSKVSRFLRQHRGLPEAVPLKWMEMEYVKGGLGTDKRGVAETNLRQLCKDSKVVQWNRME